MHFLITDIKIDNKAQHQEAVHMECHTGCTVPQVGPVLLDCHR